MIYFSLIIILSGPINPKGGKLMFVSNVSNPYPSSFIFQLPATGMVTSGTTTAFGGGCEVIPGVL